MKLFVFTLRLAQKSFRAWRGFVVLENNLQVFACGRAEKIVHFFFDMWRSELVTARELRQKAEKFVNSQRPEISRTHFVAWYQLTEAVAIGDSKFPIRKYFRALREFRVSKAVNIKLFGARRVCNFLLNIFNVWKEKFHTRLKKRVGNLRLLSLTASHLEFYRVNSLFKAWRLLWQAVMSRNTRVMNAAVEKWRRYVLRRQVKKRKAEIAMNKFLLDKSGDFARLLISTLDERKTQRMHQLMSIQQERFDHLGKYFRLWRDLAN